MMTDIEISLRPTRAATGYRVRYSSERREYFWERLQDGQVSQGFASEAACAQATWSKRLAPNHYAA